MEKKIDPRAFQLALASFVFWGFFPIYWKLLTSVGALEILAHRMIWSLVFYLGLFLVLTRGQIRTLFRESGRNWLLSTLSGLLLALNWGLYIYAVNSGHILEGSLAYFINPLLNVVVGVAFFRERMSSWMKSALLLATTGVMIQVLFASRFPWISLVLAITFCAYGAVKKILTVNPSQSSVMEGVFLFFPALFAAIYLRHQAAVPLTTGELLLLMGSGIVTGLPLYFFSAATQKLSYGLVGMLQFIAPSLQFLVGVFMYGERLEATTLVSFVFIWLGVAFYIRDKRANG